MAASVLAAGADALLIGYFGRFPFLPFIPAILLSAYVGGTGPALLATGLASLFVWFTLAEPRYSFALDRTTYALGITLLLTVGTALGMILEGLRGRAVRAEQQKAAVSRSEKRYRALAEAIAAFVWTAGHDGRMKDLSRWRALTGQSSDEVRGWGWLGAIHPDDREATREAWRRSIEARTVYDVEYRLRHADGRYRWYNARAVPVTRHDGSVREWIGVCFDVTERKAAEERQRLLIAELDHRVRNILAVVLTIAKQSLPPGEAAETLRGRLAALAHAHGLLAAGRWEGASLHALIEAEVAPYESGGPRRISMTGEEVRLAPRSAQTLALVLHELVTNAVKHGALSRPAGRVSVAWTVAEANTGPRLSLVWQETGGPEVRPPSRRGFGSHLIERSVAYELDGIACLEFRAEGVRCEIDIPLPETDGAPRAGKDPQAPARLRHSAG